MTKQIRGFAVRAAATGPVTFLASSTGLARDGMIIERGAWDLGNFRSNPVILWSHDYLGSRPPIGRAVRVEETAAGLEADIDFDMEDPFAAEVRRKIASGYLNAVSVGWDTIRSSGNRVTRAELIDISVVNVPGDPSALAIARSAYRGGAGSSIPNLIPRLSQLDPVTVRKLHAAICGPEDMKRIRIERTRQIIEEVIVKERIRRNGKAA